MQLNIDDNLSFKMAVHQFKKTWVETLKKPNETMTSFAKRIGIERSNLYKLLKYLEDKPISIIAPERFDLCYFCGSDKNIELHHVYSRKENSKELAPFCTLCHKKFHYLASKWPKQK